MTTDKLLHEQTEAQIDAFVNNPAHSLLIYGPAGSGKMFLARYISASLMAVDIDRLDDQPHFTVLGRPEGKQEIPIDSVRQIIKKLALKTAGRKRIVIIEDAHVLSEEAQNALLKSIEEPPPDTHFILTVPAVSLLLPTITSRSRKLPVKPVSLEKSLEFFGNDNRPDKITGAWNLSRGSVGLLSALLNDDNEHPLKTAVEQAKLFVRMNKYERAIFLDKISPDKNAYSTFLDALDRLLSALATSSISSEKPAQTARILLSRKLINGAIQNLSANVSPRLISLRLAQGLTI